MEKIQEALANKQNKAKELDEYRESINIKQKEVNELTASYAATGDFALIDKIQALGQDLVSMNSRLDIMKLSSDSKVHIDTESQSQLISDIKALNFEEKKKAAADSLQAYRTSLQAYTEAINEVTRLAIQLYNVKDSVDSEDLRTLVKVLEKEVSLFNPIEIIAADKAFSIERNVDNKLYGAYRTLENRILDLL